MQTLVVALCCGEHVGEQALGALVALGGVDRERADDRLRHRDGDLTIGIVDANGAISLFEDDRLQPLLVECRRLGLAS